MQKYAGLISENKVTNEKFRQKIQSSSKLSEKVSKKFQLTDTSQAAHAPTVHSLATCVPSEAAVPHPLPRPTMPSHVSCFMFRIMLRSQFISCWYSIFYPP